MDVGASRTWKLCVGMDEDNICILFYKNDVKAQPGHTADITAVKLSMGFSVSL